MDVNAQLNELNRKLNMLVAFISQRLQNYGSLSLGEKIAYPVTGLGLLLTLLSIILLVI